MKKERLSDAKLLRFVGKIAIAFCELDDSLESGICTELHSGCDDFGYLVTCKMNFQQKVELYERLVIHRFTCCNEVSRITDFQKFINEINSVQDFRNNIIHNIRFNEDGELFLRQRFKKSLMKYNEDIDESRLPYKGINSQYPKFKKLEVGELMLKKFLKRIRDLCERFLDLEMQ